MWIESKAVLTVQRHCSSTEDKPKCLVTLTGDTNPWNLCDDAIRVATAVNDANGRSVC